MKKKVLVAMSGGVDSSAAAAILQGEGYDVIGVTLKLWPKYLCENEKSKSCCSFKDAEDARKVANQLKIPFYLLDCQKEFSQTVIDYFCIEYASGRTPNPCIVCNDQIKFGYLLQKAQGLGVDLVATGHYAAIRYDQKQGRFSLHQAKDKTKDQSYVLFGLTQTKLSKLLMPLGAYEKKRVREIAKFLGLKNHDKQESQEICFTENDKYGEFLKKRLGDRIKPGAIVDKEGKVLGKHKGICFYTIGQRSGLGISSRKPLYVTAIDAKTGNVIVGTQDDIKSKSLTVKDVNWIGGYPNAGSIEADVKIRYNHPQAKANIRRKNDYQVEVEFQQPQPAVTPGQAAVFYKGEEVLGGGWIE